MIPLLIEYPIPLRSALIFSVELVLGPEKIDISNCPTKKKESQALNKTYQWFR